MAQLTKEDLNNHAKAMEQIAKNYAEGQITLIQAAEQEAAEIQKFRLAVNKANSELDEDMAKSRIKLERGLEQNKTNEEESNV